WYMVQSGLADRVEVSQYRLALHLSLAILIFGALLWLALDLPPARRPLQSAAVEPRQHRPALLLLPLLFLQLAPGALVAGLKAGLTYNTWPLMDGRLVPKGILLLKPWYLNIFENVATVQFNHRMMAYLIAALALWHLWSMRRSGAEQLRSAQVLAG